MNKKTYNNLLESLYDCPTAEKRDELKGQLQAYEHYLTLILYYEGQGADLEKIRSEIEKDWSPTLNQDLLRETNEREEMKLISRIKWMKIYQEETRKIYEPETVERSLERVREKKAQEKVQSEDPLREG